MTDSATTGLQPVEAASKPGQRGEASAQYVGEDARTQGNWKKLYGREGYQIAGDEVKLPPYAQFSCETKTNSYDKHTDDVRALTGSQGGRAAIAWYADKTMTCDLKLTDGREHTITLYTMDWRKRKTFETLIEVLDADSEKVLDSHVVKEFDNGKYVAWRIKGSVKIRFSAQQGQYVFLYGIFFQ